MYGQARRLWLGDEDLLAAGIDPWTDLPTWLVQSAPSFGDMLLADNCRTPEAGSRQRHLYEAGTHSPRPEGAVPDLHFHPPQETMKEFNNKVAAITGAASGMGRELALELARRGCHLALSDIDAAGLDVSAALARQANAQVRVSTLRVDIAQRDAVYAWAEQVARDHGRVNLIFNNAGVALSTLLESVRQEDFEWIMGINFWGVVWGTQAFLPHLRASGEGHVINTSSLFGLMSVPLNGCYNASKFAVRGYTEALRMELELLKAPVSATSVHPGGVRTAIARNARMDASSAQVTGIDPEAARAGFDKLLDGTSAQSAALQILRGVQRDQRRVLVGRDAWFADKLVRLLGSWYQPLVLARSRRPAGSDR
jgi:NAD(P)-dependent dehydrogenase (short-subunit alcohol dehydrogenase family)